MLDEKGFDLWADGYDRSVGLSDDENSYPFAGYKEVLNLIYQTVMQKPEADVLDLGFGTGTLTARLYEQGCRIYGQDFSERMIELAKQKMPGAHLYHGDFSGGLVSELGNHRYDFIIATYSLHHLDDVQKAVLLNDLKKLLKEDGMIIIGDIAFQTRTQLDQCRREYAEIWDEDEIYSVYEELEKTFPGLEFLPVSFCAGILSLKNEEKKRGFENETGI